jgi:tetratricopeptide (TPR) repeat protein
MKFLQSLPGILGFQARAIHSLAERQSVVWGMVCFSLGFLAYAYVRNFVYADLPEIMFGQTGILNVLFNLNIIQSILFLTLIYIPVIILTSNALSRNGIGFFMSSREYRSHLSALFPLWGVLSLIAAPLQWLIPHFLMIGEYDISIGIMFRSLLLVFYTLWAIKQLNYLSMAQAVEVFALSLLVFPIYFVLTVYRLSILIVIAIPLIFWIGQQLRRHWMAAVQAQDVSHHLQALTANPQNADAHYRLGLIHWSQENLDAALDYFSRAAKINPLEPSYLHFLGRTYEKKDDWLRALEHYEAAYRLDPEYGSGVIGRDLGKGYLHTGQRETGEELLKNYVSQCNSDLEGRYWLAEALKKSGNAEQMWFHLNVIIEQARSSPYSLRKNNREWIYRARDLLRDLKLKPINLGSRIAI